jgi:hypothetical protein
MSCKEIWLDFMNISEFSYSVLCRTADYQELL